MGGLRRGDERAAGPPAPGPVSHGAGCRSGHRDGHLPGDTTRWFAGFGVPVWTVEVQPRNYWVSRYRLLAHRTLHLACGDSVAALRRWIASGAFSTGLSLFYLDAH